MKPSLLTRHLEKAHPEFRDKDLDFFKHKETMLEKQRLDKSGMFLQHTNSLRASYEVSLLIAKQKKTHTIGEDLVLPTAKVMVLLQSEISSGICAKLCTVAASNNRVHMP